MRLNLVTLDYVQATLGSAHALYLTRLAAKQDYLEQRWRNKLERMWEKITKETVESLEKTGKATVDEKALEKFFVEHSFAVMFEAMRSTSRMPKVMLASYPKGPMPRSLKNLRILWDAWRKRGEVPIRQQKIVAKVKKAYINKCQDTWRKYSEGAGLDKREVIQKVTDSAWTEYSRGQTIVETETTRYWNQTRKAVYSQSDDVTHFLYVPIRDHATTKWCSSRRMLVYGKNDPILDKETPPIHWRCRSELLPLTPLNPRHQALIEDKSKARRSHSCEPLPPGWNS